MPASGRRRSAPTHWGWHQLTDDSARRLVTAAGIHPGDLVLDVGAGTGALTGPLVDAGARVVAVELHPRRAQLLRERFEHAPVTVVRTDAADLRWPRRPFKVVANPPFGVTTALLKRLLAPRSRLLTADLVLPRHAGHRWSNGRGPGAERWRRVFDVHVARTLPRAAFRPVPPRAPVVLRIERADAISASGRARPTR